MLEDKQMSLLSGLPQTMVKRLGLNTSGRDFLVGDLHGAYDTLKAAMREVRFDPELDRIISVGDLIDRGMGSARVTRFLQAPFVHAVRGNHDHDFAQLDPAEVRILANVPRLGMAWARNLSDEALFEIQAQLRELPLAIELETARGLVGVVHAQPLQGLSWPQFVRLLEQRDSAAIECALTSRRRIREGDTSIVAGVGRIYVGHTIQEDGARMFGNVVAIDTGAVLREMGVESGHHLTLVNAAARTEAIGPVVDAGLRAFAAIEAEGEGAFRALRPAC